MPLTQEEVRARDREYYRRNPERKKARSRAAYAADPEAAQERMKDWRSRNPQRLLTYQRERRAKRKGVLPTGLHNGNKLYQLVIANDPCSYCGASADSLDHIVPQASGGSHEWTNFTQACMKCNRAKSDKPLLLFLLERQ